MIFGFPHPLVSFPKEKIMSHENHLSPLAPPDLLGDPHAVCSEARAFYWDSPWRFLAHAAVVLLWLQLVILGFTPLPAVLSVIGLLFALLSRRPAVTITCDHLVIRPLFGDACAFPWHTVQNLASVNNHSLSIQDQDGQYKDLSLLLMKKSSREQLLSDAEVQFRKARRQAA